MMGPGFFMFFQSEGHQVSVPKKMQKEKLNDDDEVVELTKIIFSFLEREDG